MNENQHILKKVENKTTTNDSTETEESKKEGRSKTREALSYIKVGFEQKAWPVKKGGAFDSPEKSSTERNI